MAISSPAASTVGGRSSEMNSRTLASSRRKSARSCRSPTIAAPRVALEQSFDVVDLEDRVREGLRGAVVDLAPDPGPLGVERFEDQGRPVHRLRSIGLGHGVLPGQPIS